MLAMFSALFVSLLTIQTPVFALLVFSLILCNSELILINESTVNFNNSYPGGK